MGDSNSSWIFNIHPLKALNSWWEAFNNGFLKVRRQSYCLGFILGLSCWSSDGDKGAREMY